MTPTALYVLGMHRSGTSALTRAVAMHGFAQSGKLLAANEANPKGYWESQAAVALNTDYLRKLHRYWADPKPIDLFGSGDLMADAVARARALWESEFDPTVGGVLKDPRLCLTLPIWHAAAQELDMQAKCLISLRNPRNVCASLRRRNSIRIQHGEKLWITYMLRAEHYSRGMDRAIVRYEDLLGDWQTALGQALAQIDVQVPAISVETAAQVHGFLDADLNHSADTDEAFFDAPEHSDSIKALYRLYCAPDCLDRHSEFDALRGAWLAEWALKSKGAGASFYGRRFPDWHLRHAVALKDAGDTDGAIEACLKALDIDPEHTLSLFRIANLYFGQRRYQEALGPISRAVALQPGRRPFHMLHARALEKLNRLSEAQDQAQAAIDAEPEWGEAHFLHAQMLLRRDDLNAAVAGFKQALRLTKGPNVRYEKALALANAQLEGAFPVLPPTAQSPANAQPKDPKALLAQAGRYIADRNWRGASGLLHDCVQQGDASLKALQYYATAQMRLGHAEEAIATLKRILELSPTSVRHQFLLASQQCLVADWSGARAARDTGAQLGEGEISTWAAQQNPDAEPPVPYTATSVFAWQSALYWQEQLRHASAGDDGEAIWPLGRARPALLCPKIDAVEGDTRPELSVVLPVYDVQKPDWLRGAIDSVLGQVEHNSTVEVIVLDDASPNDTAAQIASEYGPMLRYQRNREQLGLLGNHNKAIRIARGEFVHILHQDDWVLDGFYDGLLPPLQANPKLSMGFCAARIVDGQDQQVRVPVQLIDAPGVLPNWLPRIVHGQLINFPSVIVRRAAYETIGGFSPSLTFAFDWEMWARLAAHGDVWHDTGVRAVYRNHAGSATQLFTAFERLIDCFHTIAAILPLLPDAQANEIAPHALTRVIANTWAQVREAGAKAQGAQDSVDFLLQGCNWRGDYATVMTMLKAD